MNKSRIGMWVNISTGSIFDPLATHTKSSPAPKWGGGLALWGIVWHSSYGQTVQVQQSFIENVIFRLVQHLVPSSDGLSSTICGISCCLRSEKVSAEWPSSTVTNCQTTASRRTPTSSLISSVKFVKRPARSSIRRSSFTAGRKEYLRGNCFRV